MYIELVKNIKEFCIKNLTKRASVHREVLPKLGDYISSKSTSLFCGPLGVIDGFKTEVYPVENFDEWVASEVVKDILVYLIVNKNTSTISGKSIVNRMNEYEKYLRENAISKEKNEAKEIVEFLEGAIEISDTCIESTSIKNDFIFAIKKALNFVKKYI